MTDTEIKLFWELVRFNMIADQRKGQAMMNALWTVAPELYNMVAGTQYDIFYRDTSQDIYRFREYVGV